LGDPGQQGGAHRCFLLRGNHNGDTTPHQTGRRLPKGGQRDVFTWDDEVRGFGLKITPTGRRVYVAQYRPAGGRRSTTKRITLGEHGKIAPEQARILAKLDLARVAQGHDPAAERAARRGGSTVREFGEAYLADVKIRRKPTTAAGYSWLWSKHVLPALGSKPVATVTRIELRRLHRSLHKTPYLANRVVALLGSFFSFAAKEGHRNQQDNPAHGIELYPEKGRERFLTPKEFARLGDALTRAERNGLPPAPQHRLESKALMLPSIRQRTRGYPSRRIRLRSQRFAYLLSRAVARMRFSHFAGTRWTWSADTFGSPIRKPAKAIDRSEPRQLPSSRPYRAWMTRLTCFQGQSLTHR